MQTTFDSLTKLTQSLDITRDPFQIIKNAMTENHFKKSVALNVIGLSVGATAFTVSAVATVCLFIFAPPFFILGSLFITLTAMAIALVIVVPLTKKAFSFDQKNKTQKNFLNSVGLTKLSFTEINNRKTFKKLGKAFKTDFKILKDEKNNLEPNAINIHIQKLATTKILQLYFETLSESKVYKPLNELGKLVCHNQTFAFETTDGKIISLKKEKLIKEKLIKSLEPKPSLKKKSASKHNRNKKHLTNHSHHRLRNRKKTYYTQRKENILKPANKIAKKVHDPYSHKDHKLNPKIQYTLSEEDTDLGFSSSEASDYNTYFKNGKLNSKPKKKRII